MDQKSYFLIPTAEKVTWKFDRPVIFLGEWCRRYDDRMLWSAMEASVNPSYGNDQKKKDQDAAEAEKIFTELFPKLCSVLNDVHGVKHSERFWRILLGSWFHHYIKVVINRVNTLEECLKRYPISEIADFLGSPVTLASQNSHTAANLYSDDRWNHQFTLKLLDLIAEKEISKIPISDVVPRITTAPMTRAPKNLRTWFTRSTLSSYHKVASKFTSENEPLLISSYLSLKSELFLQVLLRQFPKMHIGEMFIGKANIDLDVRLELSRKFGTHRNDLIESVTSKFLFELIPICYLEAFRELELNAQKRAFPASPKLIFTSNSFEYDEAFKFSAASKVENGTKLIYGQHGNNYGTHRYMNPLNEETTCDKFLTWGWQGSLPQHTPAFMLRNSGKRKPQINAMGHLLLIEDDEPIRFETWDTSNHYLEYLVAQKHFVGLLASEPKSQLLVRLTAASNQKKNSEVRQWKDFDYEIEVDYGFTKIRDLIERSRLIVHSYDSTGLLETLAWNLPTLAFWNGGFENLRDEVIPDYQLLHDIGIIHFTAAGAAEKVNEIWGDIDGWWASQDIQRARQVFCKKYAYLSGAPNYRYYRHSTYRINGSPE